MIKKLFSLIYFLFSIFLLLAVFKNRTILEFIIIGICTIFMYVILKKNIKFKISNKIINLLIFLAIIVRIGLIFLNYGEVYSDYEKFFYGAVDFSNDGTISKYVAVFPHLISYIASLGGIFKVFGISYKAVVIFNIVCDLISALMLKKMFNSKKAALIWLVNPINIIWCGICHPVVITNTFFIMSIFVFYNIIKYFNSDKRVYILSILFGVVLSITNLFRPIMIIFVIAMIIYFLLNLVRENVKKTITVISLILIVYFVGNSLSTFCYKTFINDSIASKSFGWSMYIGANMDSSGAWNQVQQLELDAMLDTDETPTEIQEHFLKKGINLYISNGVINNIKLVIKKAMVLVGGPDWLSAAVFNLMMERPLNSYVLLLLEGVTLIVYYLLLLFNLIFAYVSLKSKMCDFSTLLQLFIIGMVTSNMFVEVAERYSLPLLVPYTLLLIINRNKVLEIFKGKK